MINWNSESSRQHRRRMLRFTQYSVLQIWNMFKSNSDISDWLMRSWEESRTITRAFRGLTSSGCDWPSARFGSLSDTQSVIDSYKTKARIVALFHGWMFAGKPGAWKVWFMSGHSSFDKPAVIKYCYSIVTPATKFARHEAVFVINHVSRFVKVCLYVYRLIFQRRRHWIKFMKISNELT